LKHFLRYHAPLIFWASAILVVSSIPYMQVPDLGFSLEDKCGHMAEYFVLGLCMARSLSARPVPAGRFVLILFVAATLFAAVDEAHQLFIPGRFASWTDFLADFLGVSLSIPLGIRFRRAEEIG
jgi:VanZ family protein